MGCSPCFNGTSFQTMIIMYNMENFYQRQSNHFNSATSVPPPPHTHTYLLKPELPKRREANAFHFRVCCRGKIFFADAELWVQIPALPLWSNVTLGELLTLSEPQFLISKPAGRWRCNIASFAGFLWVNSRMNCHKWKWKVFELSSFP